MSQKPERDKMRDKEEIHNKKLYNLIQLGNAINHMFLDVGNFEKINKGSWEYIPR